MKKSKFLVQGMLEVIFFVPALHSSLLLYSKGVALHPFKIEGKSLLSGVGRAVSVTTPSPKVRSDPAVILEPTEVT